MTSFRSPLPSYSFIQFNAKVKVSLFMIWLQSALLYYIFGHFTLQERVFFADWAHSLYCINLTTECIIVCDVFGRNLRVPSLKGHLGLEQLQKYLTKLEIQLHDLSRRCTMLSWTLFLMRMKKWEAMPSIVSVFLQQMVDQQSSRIFFSRLCIDKFWK